jgi:hypothetical protein
MTTMVLDFKADWQEFITKEMLSLSLKYDCAQSLKENTIRYLNAKRRIVGNQQRKVHEAKELHIPLQHTIAYRRLKKLISTGGDLNAYLSRGIEAAKANDLALNDWGIHHLHFCPRPARSREILFVKFTDTDAFMIQVLSHGRDHSEVWVNTRLIEILHSNWPEIMEPYRASAIDGESLAINERKNIRNNHGNVVIKISNGTSYFPPGGGLTASGRCITDIIDCDKIISKLTEWEYLVKANESRFRSALNITAVDELSIKLKVEDQGCSVYDPVRNILFRLKLE